MHLRVIVLFFKDETNGSRSQDVDQSLKLHGYAKASVEHLTERLSNGAQWKERNPNQSSKYYYTSSNHVKRGISSQTDSVEGETQDSAGEIGITNSSSSNPNPNPKKVYDKGYKNYSKREGK